MKKIQRSLAVFLSLALLLTLVGGCAELPKLPKITLPFPLSPAPSTPASSGNVTPVTPIAPEWSVPVSPTAAPALPSIADVVAKVKPSVVAINTEIISQDFLNQPFRQSGAGSGWIIREDGYIVTNNHVVADAEHIAVVLDDGRTFPVDPKNVVTDPVSDLAVLKIDAKGLPAAAVGDSQKLRVGDWIVVIGNSLGLGITAKEGIISRHGVSVTLSSDETLYDLLEISAAINPGNSGGPLVNMAGEVIGITSVKIAAAGIEGMGYAISSNQVLPIVQSLITRGYIVRPWLGVGMYSVSQLIVSRYDLAVDTGAFVVNVAEGSPASKAGLKAGDVITKFDGSEITDVNELARAIRSSQVGQRVEITFWRGKTESTTFAVLVESPPPS